jgi:hypothetical protein
VHTETPQIVFLGATGPSTGRQGKGYGYEVGREYYGYKYPDGYPISYYGYGYSAYSAGYSPLGISWDNWGGWGGSPWW